jgi:hypothetical protein
VRLTKCLTSEPSTAASRQNLATPISGFWNSRRKNSRETVTSILLKFKGYFHCLCKSLKNASKNALKTK